MPTIRELEDLIIDAIYLDLISGRLDQKYQQLEVEYALGRDVEQEKTAILLASLQEWYASFNRSNQPGSSITYSYLVR